MIPKNGTMTLETIIKDYDGKYCAIKDPILDTIPNKLWIYRDPVERIISVYSMVKNGLHISYEYPVNPTEDEFIEFLKLNINNPNCESHIKPQVEFVKELDKTWKLIRLENLSDVLKSFNVNPVNINVNPTKHEVSSRMRHIIKTLYYEDSNLEFQWGW